MEIFENGNILEIWLTTQEKEDTELQKDLKPLIAKYKLKKYTVALFVSGNGNLFEGTRDLLLYNRVQINTGK